MGILNIFWTLIPWQLYCGDFFQAANIEPDNCAPLCFVYPEPPWPTLCTHPPWPIPLCACLDAIWNNRKGNTLNHILSPNFLVSFSPSSGRKLSLEWKGRKAIFLKSLAKTVSLHSLPSMAGAAEFLNSARLQTNALKQLRIQTVGRVAFSPFFTGWLSSGFSFSYWTWLKAAGMSWVNTCQYSLSTMCANLQTSLAQNPASKGPQVATQQMLHYHMSKGNNFLACHIFTFIASKPTLSIQPILNF